MSMKLSVSMIAGTFALVALSGFTKQAAAADVNVSASVVAACTLTGADITFGPYIVGQNTANNSQADIKYNCGAGRNITLELNYGLGGNANTKTRTMTGVTNAEALPYNLFQENTHSTVWGTGADGVDVTSTAAGDVLVPVFGQIPGGAGVGADNFSDTVTFNVTING